MLTVSTTGCYPKDIWKLEVTSNAVRPRFTATFDLPVYLVRDENDIKRAP